MALAATPLTKFPTGRRKNMDAQNWEVGNNDAGLSLCLAVMCDN